MQQHMGCGRAVRVRRALAGLSRRAPVGQAGQSLTELALLMPILALLVLIAADLGLALHAHTGLTQATQQAAQYLLHHPADTASCPSPLQVSCVQAATASEVEAYLDSRGFPHTTVTLTFGATPSGAQKEIISASYPFPVVAPILDNLSAGALQHGTLVLGASAVTIAATSAPAITAVDPVYAGAGFQGYKITWTPPPNPAAVGLYYQIYAQGLPGPIGRTPASGATSASAPQTYTDHCGTGGAPACLAPPSPYYSYHVVAVQTNGLASPKSAEVHP
jgi:hypothetical protein